MAHRDDEEALRAKLDERDRELAEAQRALDGAKAENERLRAGRPSPMVELARGLWGKGGGPAVVAVLFALLTAGLGLAFFLLRSAPAPYPPAVYTPAPYVPPPPPSYVPPPPPPAAITVHLAAHATAVTGDTRVRVDDPCTITATIWPTLPVATVGDVSVACAGTPLYSSTTAVFGVSMTSSEAFVWPDATPGMVRYEVTHSDTGERSGNPQIVLHSWTGEGAIFQTGLGAFRVELEVDPVSEPIGVPPGTIWTGAGAMPHVLRHGHVVSAEPPGLAEGTRCRVAIRPTPGDPRLNTRTHVRCGAVTLYGDGTAGLAPRTGDTITDVGTTTEDGDPAMALDLAAGTLSIRDVRNGVTETVEVALDPETAPPPAAPPATPPP